jgi:large subunit ribosomal protein L25
MEEISIKLEKREVFGKGAAKRLRREGMVPVILYGSGWKGAISLKISAIALDNVLHATRNRNVLMDLGIDGEKKKRKAIIKALDRHPVSRIPLHVDFYEVEKGHKVIVEVPVHITGEAQGVEAGGILQPELRKLKVECMPKDIPESIDVDVTSLGIGESLHLRDLMSSEGQKFMDDLDATIVSVVIPAAEIAAKTAEETSEEIKESFEEKGEEEGEEEGKEKGKE